METFDESINDLIKIEKEKRLAIEIKKKRSIGFDCIVTRNKSILFIEAKANQTEHVLFGFLDFTFFLTASKIPKIPVITPIIPRNAKKPKRM